MAGGGTGHGREYAALNAPASLTKVCSASGQPAAAAAAAAAAEAASSWQRDVWRRSPSRRCRPRPAGQPAGRGAAGLALGRRGAARHGWDPRGHGGATARPARTRDRRAAERHSEPGEPGAAGRGDALARNERAGWVGAWAEPGRGPDVEGGPASFGPAGLGWAGLGRRTKAAEVAEAGGARPVAAVAAGWDLAQVGVRREGVRAGQT